MKSIKHSVWPYNLYQDIFMTETDKNKLELERDVLTAISYIEREKWRDIILYRYRDKMTLEMIAGKYNISRDRVRQIINKILAALRRNASRVILEYGLNDYAQMKKQDVMELYNNKQKELNKHGKGLNIDYLELSIRPYNCLRRAGITYIDDLLNKSPEDIVKIKNLGKRSFIEIMDKLKEFNYKYQTSESASTIYNRCINEKRV